VRRTTELLQGGMDAGLHRGGQLYVSLRTAVRADLAFGESRPGEPVRDDSLMLWLSSCKPVTALAIGQLRELGRLDFDDPVARHVPEFAQGGKEAVTIRHLLTHTAGIRTLDVGWPKKSWEEIVADLCAMRLEPRWTPGEKAGYHRESSWFLLGELVQRLSGLPFTRYVRGRVFEPLGMANCWIGMPPDVYARLQPRLVAMWDTAADPPRDHGWSDDPARAIEPNPASNGYGPLRELGRFYEALLDGGRGVVRPDTVVELTRRQRVGLYDHTFRHVMDWGLGFIPNPRVYEDADVPYAYGPHASPRAFGHSGYRSSTAFADPEHGLVVALAVNGTPSEAAHVARFHELCAAIYEDLGLFRP
jgi:CubicO group peptidase (beta-lactamase class C family)